MMRICRGWGDTNDGDLKALGAHESDVGEREAEDDRIWHQRRGQAPGLAGRAKATRSSSKTGKQKPVKIAETVRMSVELEYP